MTTLHTQQDVIAAPATVHRRSHLVRHFLEMVVAMFVGMAALGGVAAVTGVDTSQTRPELEVLLMALSMAVGMTVWMRHRGHDWRAVLEMDAAMFVPFIGLFPLLWLGAISVDAMYGLGHVLMLPAMLVVMVRRRHQ